jgi:hypothetical protein
VRDRQPIDVLLVSPRTTAGWRRADDELASALTQLGLTIATCTSDYRITRHLRRSVLTTDLAEAAAMRSALSSALRRYEPRALVFSSPQATMLQPRKRLGGASAVRFDALVAANRRGFGLRLLQALERRALGRMRLLLPIGARSMDGPARRLGPRAVTLPIPIEPPPSAEAEREPLALIYAGNPDKKGLDVALRAWRVAAPNGWRLLVTGIDAEAGRRFLARRQVPEPMNVEWAGTVAPDRYEQLLASARVYLSASRFEDFGIAQLEALAAGALLVTLPSEGPFEALAFARELDPALVADSVTPEALTAALEAAIEMDEAAAAAYRDRATQLLQPYRRERVRQRLSDDVLPALLGG